MMTRNTDDPGPVRDGGMTLFELLVALTIFAIVAALALPAFGEQLRKGRRMDAVTALYAVQLAQEHHRATHYRYAQTLTELGHDADEQDSPERHYRIRLQAVAEPRLGFRALATPRPGSPQSADRCVLFVLDQSGPDLNASTDPVCWSR